MKKEQIENVAFSLMALTETAGSGKELPPAECTVAKRPL